MGDKEKEKRGKINETCTTFQSPFICVFFMYIYIVRTQRDEKFSKVNKNVLLNLKIQQIFMVL